MKNNNRKLICVLAIVLAVVVALSLGMMYFLGSSGRELKKQLDLGHKFLEEQDYAQALASFESAIVIDPMNVEAYIGMADAYIGMGDLEAAEQVLKDAITIFETNGDDTSLLQDKLSEIQAEIDAREAARLEEEKRKQEEEERKKKEEEKQFLSSLSGFPKDVRGALFGDSYSYIFDGFTWNQRKELCHPLIEKLLKCIDYSEENNLERMRFGNEEIPLENLYTYCENLYVRCNELDECYELRKRQAESFGTPEILSDGYIDDFSYTHDKYGRVTEMDFSIGKYIIVYYMGNLYATYEDISERSPSTDTYEYDSEGRPIKLTMESRGMTELHEYTYNGDTVIQNGTNYDYIFNSTYNHESVLYLDKYGFAHDTDE